MERIFNLIAERWCKLWHGPSDMMHPVNGKVRCRRCHIEYPVTWGPIPRPAPMGPRVMRRVEILERGV